MKKIKTIKIKIRIALIGLFGILFVKSHAQIIQCSIKQGAVANEVVVFIKPDFTVANNSDYLLQLQFPIAWNSALSPVPTGLQVTIDPAFTAFFGDYGTPVVFVQSQNLATNDKYYVIALNRTVSTFTNWIAGTEYPVLTAKFTSAVTAAPLGQVKVADYASGGGDGQGNFYTAGGVSGIYYRDFANSLNNFYATPALSAVGGNASDGYVQTLGNILLPIDLLSFSGYKDGSRNQLKWTTSAEQNNKGFEVQRSLDGVNYNSIGFVNSSANGGNSSVAINYAFTDNSVTGSKQSYRLRQVDMGGRSKLSNIVLIKSDKPILITIDGIFPNPATTVVNMMISSPNRDKVQLLISDMNGRNMMQRSLNIESGSNTLPVDVSALASGTYMVKMISSGGGVSSGKFVKQ